VLLRLLAFSAQRTGIRDAGMSARESQTLVKLRPGAGKAAAPPTRCGPKLRDALGICEHPLALKEPPQQ
jgi:hypothetical protein